MPMNKQKRIAQKKSERGMELIIVVVASFIASIGALLLAEIFSFHTRFYLAGRRKVSGNEVLASTGHLLQQLNIDAAYSVCATQGAIPGPVNGSCVANGQLNPNALSPDPVGNPAMLGVRRDWSGNPLSEGQVCVDLFQCQYRGGGRLLEIVLKGYWLDPRPGIGLNFKTITVEKTRW